MYVVFAIVALLQVCPGSVAMAAPSGETPIVAGSARERALARVAARTAASESARGERGTTLALAAPTGADDEVPLSCSGGICSSGAGYSPKAQPASAEEGANVLPLTISVRVQDGVCEELLQRGTPLPARAARILTTSQDNQQAANVSFYLGERSFCKGNRPLGGFQLAPLPLHSYRSFVQLEIVVEVGVNGHVICRGAEIEGRLLGDTFAEAFWQGPLLTLAEASPDEAVDVNSEVALFSHALAKHLPVLLATRSVRLPSGRDIIIRQHQRREEERVGTGGVLWEAAIVLADYVSRNSEEFGWQGKRVLELGAGTGLVAISLALEGASVCATDGNPKVIEGARLNADGVGSMPGTVDVEIFDWNSQEDLERIKANGPWDVILGSDLVYPGNAGRHCVASNDQKPPADKMLIDLLTKLALPQTQVILALKDRTGEVARFAELVNSSSSDWKATRALPETIMPEFRAMPSIHVLHMHRRQAAV